MGSIFSRWRKKETSEEILGALQKDIDALETSQHRNEQLRKKYIGMLLLYSVVMYIIVALVFYFKYFPTNWKDRVIRTIPLLIFPLVIYGVKRLLHYVFVSRMTKNARVLEELKEKKKTVLEEVKENETYKTAKELLEKYDPDSVIIKDEKKETVTSDSAPQSPVRSGQMTELRRRNVSGAMASPSGTLQKATSVPSLAESPLPISKQTASSVVSPDHTNANDLNIQRANSMSHLEPLGRPMNYGPPRPPGPPKPAFPILPRERSNMDKVVEYLVGDGPGNRYALICKHCYSHNGMALKEEFEYIAFRCGYCYHANPARKQRPTAPKLEDDPMTPGRSRKNPPASPSRPGTNRQIEKQQRHSDKSSQDGSSSDNDPIAEKPEDEVAKTD